MNSRLMLSLINRIDYAINSTANNNSRLRDLTGYGFVVSSTAPVRTDVLWIDSSTSICKYYNATTNQWTPIGG